MKSFDVGTLTRNTKSDLRAVVMRPRAGDSKHRSTHDVAKDGFKEEDTMPST
jgi:hypothetical protein